MNKKSNLSRGAEPPFNGKPSGSKPDGSFAVRRASLRFSLVLMLCLALGLFACRGMVSLVDNEVALSSTTVFKSVTVSGLSLSDGDRFGSSVAWLGDLDGAGGVAGVLAVGANGDDTGGTDRGAVHLLFLNADGSVRSTSKLDDSTTNGPTLAHHDVFGSSVAWLGDLDGAGDSVGVLAVGATGDDTRGFRRGAVHLLFLNTDGSVRSTIKLDDSTTNGPTLANYDVFGRSVAWLGDLDGTGDSVGVLAVGATGDDTRGFRRGAVHLLFLNADGSVRSTIKLDDSTTNGPTLANYDFFGSSVAWLGDLDGAGDSVGVLAVGATGDDTGGTSRGAVRGAVHLLFLNADGSVRSTIKLDDSTTNGPTLANYDTFGTSVAWLGDLDGAGGAAGVLAVGATGDDAVHLLFLNADGSVRSTIKLDDSTTNGPTLANYDTFGTSVAWLGDLDGTGDSVGVLAVGANGDDTGGTNRGAVHLLFTR